jgi:hypothetical protein
MDGVTSYRLMSPCHAGVGHWHSGSGLRYTSGLLSAVKEEAGDPSNAVRSACRVVTKHLPVEHVCGTLISAGIVGHYDVSGSVREAETPP